MFYQALWFRWRSYAIGGALFAAALWLYARTAAPSVMAGDSAEFQFAAPLGGIPHPTGYPLYMLLGRLATLGTPSDPAHRVTLLSALLAAAAVALGALLVLRLTGRAMAALSAGLALLVTPGLWNAATIAEVYALNALLLILLAYTFVRGSEVSLSIENQEPRTGSTMPILTSRSSLLGSRFSALSLRSSVSGLRSSPNARWRLAAAFVAGLGFSHHGSFAVIALPLFVGFFAWWLWEAVRTARQEGRPALPPALALLGGCALAGLAGLAPWLYPFVQYARYGPFDGLDHGLPRHYFWGSPTSWSDVANHLFGGAIRGGVFRLPDGAELYQAMRILLGRLRFEFGWLGGSLGALGCCILLWRNRPLALGSLWVFGSTCLYFVLLGQAVQDSLVFTLPMLLPWSLWVGYTVAAIADWEEGTGDWGPGTGGQGDRGTRRPGDKEASGQSFDDREVAAPHSPPVTRHSPLATRPSSLVAHLALLVILALTLRWGYSRLPYSNKADQWLFRTFGEGTLARLEPSAAVLVRWEQGTLLQYLRLVEGQRPDVTIDIVEPEDVPWAERIAERYTDRAVYIVGSDADAATLRAQPVWRTEYAQLFRVR